MASHDESAKKSNENEVPTFNAENLQSNMKVVYYSRTFMSIIGGVIAGIMGFTGLMGFVVYILVMAITSVCLTARAVVRAVLDANTIRSLLLGARALGFPCYKRKWCQELNFRDKQFDFELSMVKRILTVSICKLCCVVMMVKTGCACLFGG
ncbi:hypothetical protein M8C21_011793, partial [Ambrosia artemisiifolia]